MDRDTLRNLVLAVFGVLAVTLTAATLPSAFRPEQRGSGGSGAAGTGDGAGNPAPPAVDPPEAVVEIPFLSELATLFLLVVLVVALRYLYRNRRRAFRAAVVLLALALVAGVLSQFLSLDPSGVEPPSLSPPISNASSGGASGETATDPPVLALTLVLVLAAAVLGAVVAVRRQSSGNREPPSANDASSADVAAVGRAAGRAADRIEESDDVDNEVYRAWREMTSLLDLPRPETNTAGEFETAAVEAGMAPADVGELTDLFETVRYGGYEPEPADERRAIALLRRVEERYSEGES